MERFSDHSNDELEGGDAIETALHGLDQAAGSRERRLPIPFAEFLQEVVARPEVVLRNIFQVFHDMAKAYIGEGVDEYPDDPESIHFVHYDCNKLFVDGVDRPFFADRLFANRLVNLVESLKRGAQQNKIYIFRGPPGCGKSTFLNNLLRKAEEYANTEAGMRYEVVWCFDRRKFGMPAEDGAHPVIDRITRLLDGAEGGGLDRGDACPEYPPLGGDAELGAVNGHIVEIPCPSHDNPALLIPKAFRRAFFDDLFKNDRFKFKLATEKDFEWVFKDNPCTICSSLY